jgi:hypothetical protein
MYTRTVYDREQNCGLTTILQSLRVGGRKETSGYSHQQQTNRHNINKKKRRLSWKWRLTTSYSFIIANLYFDINRPIVIDLQKMEATLTHAKGVGIIFAIDRNSGSTTWHDVLTNKRGEYWRNSYCVSSCTLSMRRAAAPRFGQSRC